jgi:hypothetical protein
MALALRASGSTTSGLSVCTSTATAAVGASYAFDPSADGLPGIYAARVLERGVDPRALCAEIRADRLGVPERGAANRALIERTRMARFGRGTARHLQEAGQSRARPAAVRVGRAGRHAIPAARQTQVRWPRRLMAACLGVLPLLPLGVIFASE